MVVRSFNGDDAINENLTNAMYATLDRLVAENIITKDQAEQFKDTHLCMLVAANGGFKQWVKRIFGPTQIDSIIHVVKIEVPTA